MYKKFMFCFVFLKRFIKKVQMVKEFEMKESNFNIFFGKLLTLNLIFSVFFYTIVFLFHIGVLGILFAFIPVICKLLLWFWRDSYLNFDDITDKEKLIFSLSIITLFYGVDAIICSNFIPASILLIVPLFAITLKKDIEMIKLESIITFVFMVIILVSSMFIVPFNANILLNLILFLMGLVQIFMIIKRYTEETLSISAKSEFFMDKSKRDDMTGLYNSGAFYEEVEERTKLMAPFCIIIINIDNFKFVKDTYGQPFGDYVLRTLVNTVKKANRNQDTGFRYGREDIAVVLPKTTDDEAFRIAEKVRKSFSETTYEHNAEWVRTKRPITVSIGLIENNQRGAIAQELIEKCDQALYYSKQHGKNQTTTYHEHMMEWEDKFEDFRRKYRNYER
jgi:diguanylate cyclase (GGDEF)-like protein